MKTKLNVKLLTKVRDAILAEPRRLNMYYWASQSPEYVNPQHPPCGTVGCIAGWTAILARKGDPERVCKLFDRAKPGNNVHRAEKLLGMPNSRDRWFNNPLFFVDKWPARFRHPYEASRVSGKTNTIRELRKRAKITAQRIDHFIATGGKE